MATQAARNSSVFMYLAAIPLLIIPFALYNIIAYLVNTDFHQTVFSVPLISGHVMAVSTGDVLVMLGVLLLYAEILKSTRFSAKAIVDHVLSIILFIVMIVEFIVAEKAATSTFLILTCLSFVDVVGGFTITIRTAQRDVTFDGGPEGGRVAS
jgi:hypothetical protein